mgnify:CR=1 FL=1
MIQHATMAPQKLAPLLTARETAELLRVSERTLWTLTDSGSIPCVRVGRSVRYDQQDLETWIRSQKSG